MGLSFALWLVNLEFFADLCAGSKTGEYNSAQICFIIHIQLDILTIIFQSSVKTSSFTGRAQMEFQYSKVDLPKYFLHSQRFCACFTDYIQSFWKLFFQIFFFRKLNFYFLLLFSLFLSLKIPYYLNCILPRARVSVSYCLACFIPSSYAFFPASPSC